jgi:hypothetical protein
MADGPRLHWASKLLLGCAVLFAGSLYFWGDSLTQVLRYHVVGRDANGDVLVFDGLRGELHRLRVPVQAESTTARRY